MRYEYFVILGALVLAYLVFEKISSIADSSKKLEQHASNLIMQNEAMHGRLIDVIGAVEDCRAELGKIQGVTSDYERMVLSVRRPSVLDDL